MTQVTRTARRDHWERRPQVTRSRCVISYYGNNFETRGIMANPCSKPLKSNPFITQRDPQTGEWQVVKTRPRSRR